MIEDIDCPFCAFEFQGKLWDDGFCPQCGEEYYWDEGGTFGFFYPYVCWNKFDDLSNKYDSK